MPLNSRDATCGSVGYRYTRDKPGDGYYWLKKVVGDTVTEAVVAVKDGAVYYYGLMLDLGNSFFDDAEWCGPIPTPER
jgi:hypothetical protein